jgi:hypothetical protein
MVNWCFQTAVVSVYNETVGKREKLLGAALLLCKRLKPSYMATVVLGWGVMTLGVSKVVVKVSAAASRQI